MVSRLGEELRVDFRSAWRSDGLVPGYPWRQLVRRGRELPVSEPDHERTDEPEQQHGVPPGPEFRWKVVET